MESSNGEHGVFKWRAWSLQMESMESSNGEHGVFKWRAWSLQTESMESSNGEHGVFKRRAWSLQMESMESSNGEHGVFKRRAWSLPMESMEEIQRGNKHHQPHQLQRLHLQEQVRVGRRPHRGWVRRGVDRQTESESLDKLTGMTKNL